VPGPRDRRPLLRLRKSLIELAHFSRSRCRVPWRDARAMARQCIISVQLIHSFITVARPCLAQVCCRVGVPGLGPRDLTGLQREREREREREKGSRTGDHFRKEPCRQATEVTFSLWHGGSPCQAGQARLPRPGNRFVCW